MKLHLESNPHTNQRYSEGSNKPCVYQDPETPQRLRQNCVWVSLMEAWVGSGLLQRQGLWVQQTWVWHKPYSSWRRSSLTPPQSYQNLHRTGKQTLGRHKQICAHQDPGEMSSDPQETDPDLPMSVQQSPAEEWVSGGLLQGWKHWVWKFVHGTFWRREPLSSLSPPWFGLRSSNREATQPCPLTENWIKDLLSLALPIITRPSFPLSQSLPSGSFHKPLILLHQRADRRKTTITEN